MSELRVRALPCVAAAQTYPAGKSVAAIARQHGLKPAEIVKLASNENPLGPSPKVLRLLADGSEVGAYPDGKASGLQDLLAERLGVGPDGIILGNGSNELLELVARAFVAPGREIIYSQHSFAVYPLVTQAIGAEHVVVPAREYGHDLPAMAAAASARTGLIFLANPNNPTGTWFAAAALRDFLRAVPGEVVVVLDEAYYEYARDAEGYPDAIALLAEFPNLFITRTFSKAWGLAGLRIGYSISHPQLADWVNRIRQPFNVNAPALVAASCALGDAAHLRRSLEVNRAGLEQLRGALGRMGLECLPSLGNFILVKLQRPGRAVWQELLKMGVIVRPVDNYALPDCLRVSVGTERENQRFIDALGAVLARR